MTLSKEEMDGLNETCEVAAEAAPDVAESMMEGLATAGDEVRKSMVKDGLTDEDAQDSILAVISIGAAYIAYLTALADVADDDIRAYIKKKVEETSEALEVVEETEDAEMRPALAVVPDPEPAVVAPVLNTSPHKPAPAPRAATAPPAFVAPKLKN